MVALESSRLFCHLPAAQLADLRARVRELSFAGGDEIFKEGDPGDGIYVVKNGVVQISAALENGERHLFSQVAPGDVFGEMAVLDNQPRSACAVAAEATTVYFVPRDAMIELFNCSRDLSLTLVQEICGRLREFNRQYICKVLQAERMALVGRFASSVVHDLKNPLSIISMTAELLCAGKADDETRRTARNRINGQVERITNMVNDILEFTRGGSAKLELVPTDYASFVSAAVEEFRSEAAVRSVAIEFQTAPPVVSVPLDARRLVRALTNLFVNAMDAMEHGGKISLRFQLKGDEVITEIGDTGPGIAPQVLERLFEPFVTFGKARGTGLGLSIAQRIIEEHHGRISARNQPEGGAVFSFALPAAPPKDP